MCGLVSLQVVAEVVTRVRRELREEITTDLLLETGRRRGFTLQGEMFSVFSLASLAREMLEVEVEVETADRLMDTAWLLDLLQSGGLVVLPYDCAPDSSVCLAGGERAHWGVVTGLIAPTSSPPPTCRPLPGVRGHYLLQSSTDLQLSECQITDLVKVVVRQSKSLDLAIYSR